MARIIATKPEPPPMKPGIGPYGPWLGIRCSRFLIAWHLDDDDEAWRWILAYSPACWLAPVARFKEKGRAIVPEATAG